VGGGGGSSCSNCGGRAAAAAACAAAPARGLTRGSVGGGESPCERGVQADVLLSLLDAIGAGPRVGVLVSSFSRSLVPRSPGSIGCLPCVVCPLLLLLLLSRGPAGGGGGEASATWCVLGGFLVGCGWCKARVRVWRGKRARQACVAAWQWARDVDGGRGLVRGVWRGEVRQHKRD
jgi:hypothetical protein